MSGPLDPPRRRPLDPTKPRPLYVVWELTLACDQPCLHCGSRAGAARPEELSTERALAVVDELVALGTEEIAFIGGEAYLHPGFLQLVRHARSQGLRPTMTTGARGIDAALAKAMAEAGLFSVSVSVDGLERTHDAIRAVPGSFRTAGAALGHLRDAGIAITANSHINRLNLPELEALYGHLRNLGVRSWQVQLTVPLGRGADRPDLMLQPWELLDLVPRLDALKTRGHAEGVLVMPGNNLGYFGPEEFRLRSTRPDGQDHYLGCQAGTFLLGIESNGLVKGCPSLQTADYAAGNLTEASLVQLWNAPGRMHFARGRTVADLWGFCAGCEFAETCRAGCTFTAHALLGRPGNMPWCHHRARTLRRRGLRERLVHVEAADGRPFDNGRFELVEEPFDAPDPRTPLTGMPKRVRPKLPPRPG